MSQDWIDDCMKFHGKVLTGKYAHWCYEWDELPIDETCEEFACCCCFEKTSEIKRIQNKLNKIINKRLDDELFYQPKPPQS